MSCEICHKRKEKRFCPAIHGRICPQCCGEQREATLDCPEDCPYLQQARAHEKTRTPEQLAGEELFPKVEIGQGFYYEREPLIGGLLYELTRLSGLQRDWNDRDVTGALTALARNYERLTGSGIIYNESTANPIHRAIADELQRELASTAKSSSRSWATPRSRTPTFSRLWCFWCARRRCTPRDGRARAPSWRTWGSSFRRPGRKRAW